MIVTLDSTIAQRIATSEPGHWIRVYLQVVGTGSARIGTRKADLENAGPGYAQQGLTLSSSDGVQVFPWMGDMWAIGSVAGMLIDVEVVG